MTDPRICLLTGPIGVGKTTVAERVLGLAVRRGWSCGGILAPALRSACGAKAGIWALDVQTGERRILARTDRELGGPRMGPYSFDAETLTWAVGVLESALQAGCDLLLVDEIGKLELWQGEGLARIVPRLAAGEAQRVLVLVREALLDELQGRLWPLAATVCEVDEQNRDRLAAEVIESLAG